MKIIISPAKKMVQDSESPKTLTEPVFLKDAEKLRGMLKNMDRQSLKSLWKCSDKLLDENAEKLERFELPKACTPAVFAYEGLQYKYMAPRVFTEEQFGYISEALYIVSGMYGLLRPFDRVVPYRLEMQSALSGEGFSSLYEYWGTRLSSALFSSLKKGEMIINLASKEYSRAVLPGVPEERYINCFFAKLKNKKPAEEGSACKMARGQMVRFMSERKAEDPQELKSFDSLGYSFSHEFSDDNNYTFIKGE